MEDEIFLGVMELQEAKNHQLKLKGQSVELKLKVNDRTCTSGCKVTVEVWASALDQEALDLHFKQDYLKHLRGHEFNSEHIASVFDPALDEVTCQACGAKFSPKANECPDCGLVY